jgi:GNAT superfamily N-acetyltransferase
MVFKVRILTQEDLKEIMIEEREAWDAPGAPVLSADEETIRERIGRYPPGNIGLYDGDRLAGKCIWQPISEVGDTWEGNVAKESLDPESKECYVMNFDVRPSYRGTGASDALMLAALESMKKAGMDTMWLGGRNVPSNRKFYGRWLDEVKTIDDYWVEDIESEGKGVLYTRNLRQPIEKRKVA